jgi:hypothetical protein
VVLFTADEHTSAEATRDIHQHIIAAYRESDENKPETMMRAVIAAVSGGVPTSLTELLRLGWTLRLRAADVLAFFDRPAHRTGQQRQSTVASKTSAAPPSTTATSPTTSQDVYPRPVAPNPTYTIDCDEPVKDVFIRDDKLFRHQFAVVIY